MSARMLIVRAAIGFFLLYVAAFVCAAEKRPLTVKDAIETVRFATNFLPVSLDASGRDRYAGRHPQFVSPDGTRYVAMLVRGDVQRDGVWAEIVSARLDSMDSAARPETVAKFFTRAKGVGWGPEEGSEKLTHPNRSQDIFPFTWIDDNERVALLWEDDRGIKQVVSVNVRTAKVAFLTAHPTDVRNFALSRQGTLVYAAHAPVTPTKTKSAEMLQSGFVVTQDDAYNILEGNVSADRTTRERVELFAANLQLGTAVSKIGISEATPEVMQFSPDGEYAIVSTMPSTIPAEWEKYTNPIIKLSIHRRHDAKTRWERFAGQQLFVVDMKKGTWRPLWNAPNNLARLPAMLWSPDGRSVLLGPTFLPVELADIAGLEGTAVAEVNITTGRIWPIPIQGASRSGLAESRWLNSKLIEIRSSDRQVYFSKDTGEWRQRVNFEAAPIDAQSRSVKRIKIQIREELNTPPALYAVEEATGQERMVLDPNPRLQSEFMLGRVERVGGKISDGRPWAGRIYYPVNYRPAKRFPLVVQCEGSHSGAAFSIYGPASAALGPGYSVYAAQVLANRGIAVLHMASVVDVEGSEWEVLGKPREAELAQAAIEAAISHLTEVGLVDPTKVGLVGFSRTGWHVEYTLTHSAFPFAAALTSDNMDGSYVQEILDGLLHGQRHNGAAPVGNGLETWLARAPAFNAHRVRAPLRLHAEHFLGALLFKWEMFSQLRRLDKPVELYVIPDIAHGSHGLQNPSQLIASKEGAVDWFDFWLNSHEDPDPKKTKQYEGWHDLRSLRDRYSEDSAIEGHDDAAAQSVRTH